MLAERLLATFLEKDCACLHEQGQFLCQRSTILSSKRQKGATLGTFVLRYDSGPWLFHVVQYSFSRLCFALRFPSYKQMFTSLRGWVMMIHLDRCGNGTVCPAAATQYRLLNYSQGWKGIILSCQQGEWRLVGHMHVVNYIKKTRPLNSSDTPD